MSRDVISSKGEDRKGPLGQACAIRGAVEVAGDFSPACEGDQPGSGL